MSHALLPLLFAVIGAWPLYDNREPLIVVETRGCDGASGVASFEPARLHSIEPGPCGAPGTADRRLYQVLLRTAGGAGRFDVISVDESGVETIRAQLMENRAAALERRRY